MSVRVPLFDLALSEEDRAAVDAALRSGWLTMGPRTDAFEREFAAHLGVAHAIALSNGTAALHLALLAAGVGPGDEVVVPAITFVATAAAARYCGAEPVLADILGPHDLGIDPADVERCLSERTKAVCVVHYGGYPAAAEALRELCEAGGIALIEDAAHTPSARTESGAVAGAIGLAGCFSFFSNKVLSCGEGGLIATNDDAVAEHVRLRRSHAMTSGTWDRHRGHAPGYDVVALGYNYRLDEPRAALLSARLPGLEQDIERRRALVRRYREQLAAIDGVTVPYADDEVGRSSCYVMPTLLDEPERREAVRARMLEEHGVQTSVLYPAIHEFSAYAPARRALPRAEHAARAQLTLPLYPHLGEERQDLVLEALSGSLG
jgi:dTDP-4-amino-4,6-dideoxygalactose transaminase